MKQCIITVLIMLSVHAQAQVKFSTTVHLNSDQPSLYHVFSDYQLFTVPTATLLNEIAKENSTQPTIHGTLPGMGDVSIRLSEVNLMDKNYSVVTGTDRGRAHVAPAMVRLYAGAIDGDPLSKVRLTLADGVLYGMMMKDGITYMIEPLHYLQRGAPHDMLVMYREADVLPFSDVTCGVTERFTHTPDPVSNAGIVCRRTEMAIAADATMVTKYGSVTAVEIHNLGVMNNVMWDYVNGQLDNNIEFAIMGQYISTAEANDPLTPAYTGTNSSTVLGNFRTWGNAGNFGFTYDIAQFWTNRNIDGDGAGGSAGIVGLAYVGVVCNFSRYHILQDFAGTIPNGSGYALRVLTSHEIGHNFNASHDAAGSGFIMAPSVNNTVTWSAVSIASIDAHTNSRVCLSPCESAGVPDADFIIQPEGACINEPLQLTDRTLRGPSTWSWQMPTGTPATATSRNPVTQFATPGLKYIALTATNSAGNDVAIKPVLISDAPPTACVNTNVNTSNAGVYQFILNSIDASSSGVSGDGNTYIDRSCNAVTRLIPGTTYFGSARVGTNNPSNQFNRLLVWIDYNNDGDFSDAGELIFSSTSCYIGTVNFNFVTPAAPAVFNQFLRLRVMAMDCFTGSNPCYTVTNGQVEDYSVYFLDESVVPVQLVSFTGNREYTRNKLFWSTALESDFAGFNLQRSYNGLEFEDIANIPSAEGGNNNGSSYRFTDAYPYPAGSNAAFYRLQMLDLSGRYTMSNVVKLEDASGREMAIFPNPVKRGAMLSFTGNERPDKLTWMDIHGRTVATQQVVSSGLTQVPVPYHLPPGTWLVRIHASNASSVHRVVVLP